MGERKTDFVLLAKRALQPVWKVWREYTVSSRVLPDYIIVGAHKGGTSSLHSYLNQHPQVRPAYKKEVKFFDCNFGQGLDWYRTHFPTEFKMREPGSMTGEASPYYLFHPLAAQRLAETIPGAKLIALLRNPVDRAYSHYHDNLKTQRDLLPFEQAIEAEAERLEGEAERIAAAADYPLFRHMHYSYLAKGRYAEQLARWFRYFPREQMLILKSEDLFEETVEVYRQVVDFLGLSAWELKEAGNVAPGRYPPMKPETRRRLADYFRPHNRRLYDLLGVDFGWER